MIFYGEYDAPLGKLYITTTKDELTGVWFANQFETLHLQQEVVQESTEVMEETKRWLDCYFSGESPLFFPKYKLSGTPFRLEVWKLLMEIPYGETTTYGELSKKVAKKLGKDKMSAQAVGGAVSHNPIGILIPCHRVVGSNGDLTGYAGGMKNKVELLKLEKHNMTKFTWSE